MGTLGAEAGEQERGEVLPRERANRGGDARARLDLEHPRANVLERGLVLFQLSGDSPFSADDGTPVYRRS